MLLSWKLKVYQFLHKSQPIRPYPEPKSPHKFVLKQLNLCSSRMIRDRVSYPYKVTGKIILFYILIFTVRKLEITVSPSATCPEELGN